MVNKEVHIGYRQSTLADIDLTYRIKTRSIKTYVSRIYGWDEDFQMSFHQKNFRPENTRILYLEDVSPDRPGRKPGEDAAFGYIEVEYRDTEIFLANILIEDAYQGQGLGKAVMRQLILEADGMPGRPGLPVRLEVFRINKRARAFYERLGFRAISRDGIKYVMEKRPGRAPGSSPEK
ncbi:MAG: GNAT family N-acetyltransferase [Puia sp.]|nr:GNAT family N-acetyltransferase [Puia sp.]